MARSMRGKPRYDPQALAAFQPGPTELAQPIRPIGFGGHDKMSPLSRLQPGAARLVQNMLLRDGAYQARDGTSVIGTISGDRLVAAQEVITSDGSTYLVRFSLTDVEVFKNGNWQITSGDSWTCSYTSPFSITGWQDIVLFASGGDLFSLVFTAGYPKVDVTTAFGAPTHIKHLSTFAGRIIVSHDDQIQWCVRDDYTDWSGLGSGYEDIKSAPGGKPDTQTAVIPVSDETALVVRSNSFWQMSQTGNFDAPFAMSLLYSGKGSKWSATVAQIPQGLICLGDGQVWMVTAQGGAQDIGGPISKDLRLAAGSLQIATAMYDARWNEYRLSLPVPGTATAKVLRFSLTTGAWTEDIYPFPIRNLAPTLFAQNVSIDQLQGSIDNLQGSIDSLSIGSRESAAVYAMADEGKFVVQDRAGNNNLALKDVDSSGLATASGFRIESGDATLTDSMRRKEIFQLLLSYEAGTAVDILFEYSYDGGVTWNGYSDQTMPAAIRSNWVSADRTIDREVVQLAISTDAVPSMRLIDFVAMGREAGMVQDAR